MPSITGTDLHREYDQGNPALVWVCRHALGKYPSVTVVDTAGTKLIPKIEYVDLNTVRITFNVATSGKAFFN